MCRTWLSEGISKETQEYCQTQHGGIDECVKPKAPSCEDRTVICLEELPFYDEMIIKNLTGNDTLHEHSLGAKYEYSCKDTGNPKDPFTAPIENLKFLHKDCGIKLNDSSLPFLQVLLSIGPMRGSLLQPLLVV